MPSVNDIIKTTMINELRGVQMSNAFFWRVQDLGNDPTLNAGLLDVANAYFDAISGVLSDQWSFACAIYENMTAQEAKSVIFPNGNGDLTADSHPQDQVIRLNRYARKEPGEPIIRGATNVSGVAETLSTRGRLNDVVAFDNLRDFLGAQQILTPNWTLFPVIGETTGPGPPPIITYRDMLQVVVNPLFLKLRTRKTKLCST